MVHLTAINVTGYIEMKDKVLRLCLEVVIILVALRLFNGHFGKLINSPISALLHFIKVLFSAFL